MGCFVVPAAAAVAHFLMRKKITPWKHSRHHSWLNMLFLGGALFGIVDHGWNGELFAFGPNLFDDLMLGVTITAVIMMVWAGMVAAEKFSSKEAAKA